jgi:hypothetical protein
MMSISKKTTTCLLITMILLIMDAATAYPRPLPCRRCVLQAFWKASGAVVVAAYPESGHATEESKEAERERKTKEEAEKESRRVAEETKKRLAVGRIGTI